VIGDELCLYVKYGHQIVYPNQGNFGLTRDGLRLSLNRQKSAWMPFDMIAPFVLILRSCCVNPEEIQAPALDAEIQFIQDLNESQKELLRRLSPYRTFYWCKVHRVQAKQPSSLR
jgi:hypothetical protein